MEDSKLEKEFYKYAELGRNLPKQAPDNMLIAYGFYKQALEGNNTSERPQIGNDVVKTFMHDQWSRVKGMSKKEAMIKYIETIKGMMEQENIKI